MLRHEILEALNPNPVLRISIEGKVLYKNKSVDALLRKENISDKDIFKILPHNLKKIVHSALKTTKPLYGQEVIIDNQIFSYSIIPVSGSQYVNLYATDISELKKAEKQAINEKNKAENLLRELDSAYRKLNETQETIIRHEKMATTETLTAGVAHEIRNPLAVIGMTIQYLQSKLHLNDPNRELTDAIIKKVERLDRVTNELSSYGSSINLNCGIHNLTQCLNLNLALIKFKCRAQGIRIKKQYSKLPLIEMDEEKMDKVFGNIFNNAVQAMPEGGVLTVSTTYNEENKSVEVKIHNTGRPIQKKHLPHIFELFYTLRKAKGTGLGLPIAQSVVLRHGGQIKVDNILSGSNKGVAFIIGLPVRQARRTENKVLV